MKVVLLANGMETCLQDSRWDVANSRQGDIRGKVFCVGLLQ